MEFADMLLENDMDILNHKEISVEYIDKEIFKNEKLYTDDIYAYIEKSKYIYHLSIRINYKYGMAVSLANIGRSMGVLNKCTKAISVLNASLEICNDIDDIALTKNVICYRSYVYIIANGLEEAAESILLSIEKNSLEYDVVTDIKAKMNLGDIFNRLKKFDKAIEYFESVIEIDKPIKAYGMYDCMALFNIFESIVDSKKIKRASLMVEEVLDCNVEKLSGYFLGFRSFVLGKYYHLVGKHDLAQKYYYECIKYYKESKEKSYMLISVISICKLYSEEKRYRKIIEFEKEFIDLSFSVGNEKVYSELLVILGDVYEKIGNCEKSNHYYREYINIDKETKEKEIEVKSKNIENLIVLFETRKITEKLKIQSSTDELTKLYNRRAYNKYFDKLIQSTEDEGVNKLRLLMLDLDNFKKYNDKFGHIEGDNCLVKVSDEIKRIASKFNYRPFRYGGDEFVLIKYNKEEGCIYEEAQELKDAISALDLIYDDEKIEALKVTTSIGIFEMDESSIARDLSLNVNSMTKIVDNALYEAKTKFKNRIRKVELEK